MSEPRYNTWIRKKNIAIFAVIAAVLLIFAALWLNIIVSVVAFVLALPFIYITFILSYTSYQFSVRGGNIQTKVHDTIIRQITIKSGKLLDIGSGSGALVIRATKAMPDVTASGIDYWGKEWSDYSKKLCESNAKIEGVANRISFMQGSASKLPFADGTFDIVISCLTFHEVKDETDKAKLLREALRVLKHGGEFVFMDLFESEKVFGNLDALTASLDVTKIKTERLDKMIPLTKLLLTKRCFKYAVIINGVK